MPSRTPRPVVLAYNYPGLRAGELFLLALGVFIAGTGFVAPGEEARPARGGPPAGSAPLTPFLIGGVFALGGFGLGRLARRWGERFEATAEGVTWLRGGRVRAVLRWRDVRAVLLEDGFGNLVLEGDPGGEPLLVPRHYRNFPGFFRLLGEVVDLEALLRQAGALPPPGPTPAPAAPAAGEALASEAVPTPPAASAALPLVWDRRVSVLLAAVGAVVLAAAGYFAWAAPPGGGPYPPGKVGERERRRDRVMDYALRFGCPVIAAALVGAMFTVMTRFVVTADGIEFHRLRGVERVGWFDISSARVGYLLGSRPGAAATRLEIHFHDRLPVSLVLGSRAFEFRDAIAAAAAAAGHALNDPTAKPHRRPPRRVPRGPTIAFPKSLTVLGCERSGPRDPILLAAIDETGTTHRIELSARELAGGGERVVVQSLPGRLYFDDRLVAIGSVDQVALLALLRSAGYRVPAGEPAGPAAARRGGELRVGVEELLRFVDSDEYWSGR